MDAQTIEAELEKVIQDADAAADSPHRSINVEAYRKVASALERQEEFSDGKGLMINSPFGLLGFSPRFAAPLLIHTARRRGSRGAIQWLQKVLSVESATGLLIRTIWGVKPRRKLNLTDDTSLLSFDNLPISRQKERLIQAEKWCLGNWPTPSFAERLPTAAIAQRVEIRPFIVDASKQQGEILTKSARDRLRLVDDIRLCLALLGPTVLIPGPWWFQCLDPDLESAMTAVVTSFDWQEITPVSVPDDSEFDAVRAPILIRSYLRLKTDLKNRVRLAMERLHQSLIRKSLADQAVELGISLEAMLGDSRGENKFKIALRAALLTADDAERRMQNCACPLG